MARLISPTLDPRMIQGTFTGAEAARHRMAVGLRALEALYAAEEAHERDPTMHPEDRAARGTKLADSTIAKGTPHYDAARAGLLTQWQHLEGKITTSLRPPLSAQLALLTVQRFSQLTPEEQDAAGADMIANKRGDLLGTLLHLPSFVSGLSEPKHKYLRHKWIAAHFPEERAEMEAISKAVAAVERAGSVFLKSCIEVKQKGQKALEAQARSEAAERAIRGTV
jgi:hypothetical protein